MNFGEKIKKLREGKGLLQRQLAASLEMDTPMFSKIERGERKARREHVEQLADLLSIDKPTLFSIWLADQILDLIHNEPQAVEAIEIVKKELKKA